MVTFGPTTFRIIENNNETTPKPTVETQTNKDQDVETKMSGETVESITNQTSRIKKRPQHNKATRKSNRCRITQQQRKRSRISNSKEQEPKKTYKEKQNPHSSSSKYKRSKRKNKKPRITPRCIQNRHSPNIRDYAEK